MSKFIDPEDGRPFECLSVAELVAALAQMPQDLPVNLEGCDCWGWAIGVRHSSPVAGEYPYAECVDICRSERPTR